MLSHLRRRRVLRVAATLATLLAAPASAQQSGGTLQLQALDPASASVHENNSVSTQRPFMPVFNNLVLFDQTAIVHTPENIKPDLATEWSWNEDKTVLTFKLTEGVKWHDGEPFTSADVKCTWDTLRGARDAGWRSNPRRSWYDNLKDVTVNGDSEVSFVLGRPQAAFLSFLASGMSPVYPCHVNGQQQRTAPIGTGPFKVAEYNPGRYVLLQKNPDYFKLDRPYLDEVTIRLMAGGSAEVDSELGFDTGTFDYIDIDYAKVGGIQARHPNDRCSVRVTSTSLVVVFNTGRPPFDDPNIRRAVALALDRNAYKSISNGKFLIGGLFSPGAWSRPEEELSAFPGYGPDHDANIAEARKLIEAAGYGPNKPLKIDLATRNSNNYVDTAALVSDQLSEIYLEAPLRLLETKLWYSARTQKEFDMGVDIAGAAVDDPDDYFQRFICNSPMNLSGYCDEALTAQIRAQSEQSDPEARRKMVVEIENTVLEQALQPILYHKPSGECTSGAVHNLVISENGGHFNSWRLEDVWLDR